MTDVLLHEKTHLFDRVVRETAADLLPKAFGGVGE